MENSARSNPFADYNSCHDFDPDHDLDDAR
ncbi:hypothetical protein BH18ACT3_BH18ACT3_26220 [soil metagenome]